MNFLIVTCKKKKEDLYVVEKENKAVHRGGVCGYTLTTGLCLVEKLPI